jgi:multidrug efflux system outer membrane protein
MHGCIAWLMLGISVMLLASCSVGPNYHRPTVNTPTMYRANEAATNASLAELDWFQVYQDETLQALIREALTNNYDLRIAVSRVEQSRAEAMQARSQFVPSVNYGGTVSRGRNNFLGEPFPEKGVVDTSVSATLNTVWEVDLWGRVRRLNESARAELLASEEGRRGVRLSLLSDVASSYFNLLELDEELQIAGQTTNSFTESLRIFQQRMEGGTASGLESSRAEAALDDAAASVPSILQRISATENQLCVLLGRNPDPIERPALFLTHITLPDIPPGLPSTLLEHRPDVLESEQQLHSANALIGESVAEFFPKIGLTGFLGKVSPELSAFTLGGANAWGIAAEGTGPLFEGGRLIGQYRASKAARDVAKWQYQQTILNAFREVSDALTAREQLAAARAYYADEVSSLETAVKLSTERYVAGKASYYEVLEAQQQLFPAQLNLARTQLAQLEATVNLYKALGGGWHDDPNRTSGH